MFHGIAKFSASRFWIAFCGQLLEHSFLPKVVNESPLFNAGMTTNCCEIFPHRGVSDKLLHECFSIWPGFGEEQNPRRVTIDAMYDEGPLPLRFQLCRKNRKRRGGIGVIRGHRKQFGPLIEDYNGIVFVKHVKLPPILLS